ncbi:hypothetical protein [Eggerthella sp. YY7918]|nr:hypothetical protein [Eggerthella sp. YY7918]BAK45045.1 hypothetical protein EGYY_19460 [Eggerthella sp. YY7918]
MYNEDDLLALSGLQHKRKQEVITHRFKGEDANGASAVHSGAAVCPVPSK